MKYVLFFILFCINTLSGEKPFAAIYLQKGVGRLGDQLLYVAEGVWLARQTKLPLYVTPFEYSECFALDLILDKPDRKMFKGCALKRVGSITEINPNPSVPTFYHPLFGVPYKEEVLAGYVCRAEQFGIKWKDPNFQQEIGALFKPLIPFSTVEVPDGYYSVALHHRQGGRFDNMKTVSMIPGKFTSLSWALKKVREIHSLVQGKPLYVHIFTDDPDPEALVKRIRLEFNEPTIVWGTTNDNFSKEAIFSDLFSMAKFDFLIAPQSSFSFLAWVLGDHILTFRQGETILSGKRLIVQTENCIWGTRQLTLQ